MTALEGDAPQAPGVAKLYRVKAILLSLGHFPVQV